MKEIRRSDQTSSEAFIQRLREKLVGASSPFSSEPSEKTNIRLSSVGDPRLVAGDRQGVPAFQSGALRLSQFAGGVPLTGDPEQDSADGLGGITPGVTEEMPEEDPDAAYHAYVAEQTEPIRPRSVPTAAPQSQIGGEVLAGRKFSRIAQETHPETDAHRLHEHPHFQSYLQNGPTCPQCQRRRMMPVGSGEDWYWQCPPCGSSIHGPNHYDEHCQGGAPSPPPSSVA